MIRPYAALLFLFSGVDIVDVLPDAQVAAETTELNDVPAEFRDLENAGLACVALAVYAEARGTSRDVQTAIAHVVLQRQAARDGADPCDVVSERGQFSALDAWAFPRRPWLDNPRAWRIALDVARTALSGDATAPTICAGATGYYARGAAAPTWAPADAATCELGPFKFVIPAAPRAVASSQG